MYKSLLLFFAVVCAIGMTGCSSSVEETLEETIATPSDQALGERLGKVLADLLENNEAVDTVSAYIIYDAEDDTFLTLSDEDYRFFSVITFVLVRGDADFTAETISEPTPQMSPQGKGWVYFGKGRGKGQALKMGFAIAKKIPAETTFEIHVEYDAKGNFHIWYRIQE